MSDYPPSSFTYPSFSLPSPSPSQAPSSSPFSRRQGIDVNQAINGGNGGNGGDNLPRYPHRMSHPSSSPLSTRNRDENRQRQISNYLEQSRQSRQSRVMEQRGVFPSSQDQQEQERIDQERIHEFLDEQTRHEIMGEFQDFINDPTSIIKRIVYDHTLDLISDAQSVGINSQQIKEMYQVVESIINRIRII
jgi:hypothetical protein